MVYTRFFIQRPLVVVASGQECIKASFPIPFMSDPSPASDQPVEILCPDWLAPVQPRVLLEDHALAIQGGRILDLAPRDDLLARFPGAATLELAGRLLIPGLVNAHGHIAMSLLRGYADDYELHTWLADHIWPAEAELVSEDFVYAGGQLACAEMLMSGTTCLSDMYFFPNATARVVEQSGLRAQIAFPVVRFPNAWAKSEAECINKGLALADSYKDHDRVHLAFGPHSPYTVTDKTFSRIATLAEQVDLPVHIHLHETEQEVADSVRDYGERPLQRLERLGLVSPRLQAVHMTQCSSGELDLLARQQVQVIHCPVSNMKLASGICPVTRLLDLGVNVALGTDGAASNNSLDLLEEARTAALLGKLHARNAARPTAYEALHMATLGGARALGLEAEIGSLEPGKQADCVAIDLSGVPQQPVYHPVSQLIYTAAACRVTDVWVGGERLLEEQKPVRLDLEAILNHSQRWAVRAKRGPTG